MKVLALSAALADVGLSLSPAASAQLLSAQVNIFLDFVLVAARVVTSIAYRRHLAKYHAHDSLVLDLSVRGIYILSESRILVKFMKV